MARSGTIEARILFLAGCVISDQIIEDSSLLLPHSQDFLPRASCINIKLLALTLCISSPLTLFAQQVPDAGSLLREQNQTVPAITPPANQPTAVEALETEQAASQGPSVFVSNFEFSGNTLVSTPELDELVGEIENDEFTIEELQTVGLFLAGYYAERGYIARFTLPPQDVANGVIRFDVLEGVRGDVQMNVQGQRINGERVQAFIESRVGTGAPLNMNRLGEVLNILNEQPGINALASVQPGNGRAVDLLISATESPTLYQSIGFNNYSSKGAGQNQISFNLAVANLTGNFDLLNMGISASEGARITNIGYSTAVGNHGLRASSDISVLDYELVQSDFEALQAEGDATTFGVGLSYPLSRTYMRGSDITGRIERRLLEDNTVAGQTGDRTVTTLELGWGGYQQILEGWFAGTLNGSAALVIGNADENNATALANDTATRQANGSFAKVDFALSHLRTFDESWSLFSGLRGQLANSNLDSSARFSLGGPSGVRGFPTSEASGDEGLIASLNLTRSISSGAQISGFFDYGRIRVNDNDFDSGLTTPNSYSLSAMGVSFDKSFDESIFFGATVAQPLSNNPGANDEGEDSDGRKRGTRVWLSLSAQF